ncbi:hypothetical protein AB837_00512 [bacterium AB1]|nr:hypothetical protein AB837_00512 [bacterium AB1]
MKNVAQTLILGSVLSMPINYNDVKLSSSKELKNHEHLSDSDIIEKPTLSLEDFSMLYSLPNEKPCIKLSNPELKIDFTKSQQLYEVYNMRKKMNFHYREKYIKNTRYGCRDRQHYQRRK